MLLPLSTGYSESESATKWIFLPGHHPGTPSPTVVLLSHLCWSLPRSFREVSYSVKICPSPGFWSQTFFISTHCPNVFGPGFWHRLVQEIEREEHLFYILSEKTFTQEHCTITTKKIGWWWSSSPTSLSSYIQLYFGQRRSNHGFLSWSSNN